MSTTHSKPTPLSRYLRKRRKQLGKTREDIASALGVTPAAVSHWETGRFRPTQDKLQRLSMVLQLDTDGRLELYDLAAAVNHAA